jgi:hypothetical protein
MGGGVEVPVVPGSLLAGLPAGRLAGLAPFSPGLATVGGAFPVPGLEGIGGTFPLPGLAADFAGLIGSLAAGGVTPGAPGGLGAEEVPLAADPALLPADLLGLDLDTPLWPGVAPLWVVSVFF